MVYLINASNIHAGGGIQVTDSLCSMLGNYKMHSFIVVLSNYFEDTTERISCSPNVSVFRYNIHKSLLSLFGRDCFLDRLVSENHVDAVLTVFGPSYWKPRCPHLCGMARPHLVLRDSPYFCRVTLKERVKYGLWLWFFKQDSNYFYTENPFISNRLEIIFGSKKKVYTITNYYHQVFDFPEEWDRSIELPPFSGVTFVTISSPNPHKNFPILVEVIDYLRSKYPEFRFRFVLTQTREDLPFVPDDQLSYFVFLGKVDIRCCPYIYEQSDVMFLPSLLECFSATYPEAMKMEKPIVTTDLEFAHGLCGEAACYYSAVDAASAAEAMYRVSTDSSYASRLTESGRIQLNSFDNYIERADKIIGLLGRIAQED